MVNADKFGRRSGRSPTKLAGPRSSAKSDKLRACVGSSPRQFCSFSASQVSTRNVRACHRKNRSHSPTPRSSTCAPAPWRAMPPCRCAAAASNPSAAVAAPAGVRAIDLRGRYVVPGLIDAHVHIGSLAQMRAALESGVTTVRSAGVSHFVDVGLRELVKKGFVAGPDMIAAGYHVRPGVAPELFIDFPELGELMGGLNTADALRRAVRGEPVARRRLDQDAGHGTRRHARHRSAQAGLFSRGAAHPRRRGGQPATFR